MASQKGGNLSICTEEKDEQKEEKNRLFGLSQHRGQSQMDKQSHGGEGAWERVKHA